MKIEVKAAVGVLIASIVAVDSFSQGQVIFGNTTSSPVLMPDAVTRVPPNTAIAGLYYSTDLGLPDNPNVSNDGWLLAASTVIGVSHLFPGIYSGGTVTIPGVAIGLQVILQVRAWSTGFSSHQDAFEHGGPETLLGNSSVIGSRTPGDGAGF